MSRIGIFGGSFNPAHKGHEAAALQFKKDLMLDTLLVIPTGQAPHKKASLLTPLPEDRFQLCRLAMEQYDGITVSDYEIRNTGISYTVETLSRFRAHHPKDELFFLMGTDMLMSFHTWYKPDVIAGLCTLVVAFREENDVDNRKIDEQVRFLKGKYGAEIILLKNSVVELSSTTVRNALLLNCAEGLLSEPVYGYIREHGLYRFPEDVSSLTEELLWDYTELLLKGSRTDHVRGCMETAVSLAQHYGTDEKTILRAATIHDITKALPRALQLILIRKYDILLSDSDVKAPQIWHAITGAAVAEHILCENSTVVQAVRWHTTGHENMSDAEMILYLADMIEPTREFPGVDRIREDAFVSLKKGMTTALNSTISHVQNNGGFVHPDSLAALKWLAETNCRITE